MASFSAAVCSSEKPAFESRAGRKVEAQKRSWVIHKCRLPSCSVDHSRLQKTLKYQVDSSSLREILEIASDHPTVTVADRCLQETIMSVWKRRERNRTVPWRLHERKVNDFLEANVEGIWGLKRRTSKADPAFTRISYSDCHIADSNLLSQGSQTTTARFIAYAVFRRGASPPRQCHRVRSLTFRAENLRGQNVCALRQMALELDGSRGVMKVVDRGQVEGIRGQILGHAVLGIDGSEVISMVFKLP